MKIERKDYKLKVLLSARKSYKLMNLAKLIKRVVLIIIVLFRVKYVLIYNNIQLESRKIIVRLSQINNNYKGYLKEI